MYCIVYSRLVFPFEVGEYELECGHMTPPPLEPGLLTVDPLLSMLRTQYLSHLSEDALFREQDSDHACDGLPQQLQPSTSDLASLLALDLRGSLSRHFSGLGSAGSHASVTHTLHHLSVLAHTVCSVGGGAVGRGLCFPDQVGSLWTGVAER